MLSRSPNGLAGLDRTIGHRGTWWIPEQPERRISGTLTLQDGPRLVLESALVERYLPNPGESAAFGSDTPDEHGVIHGELLADGPITIFDTWGGSFGIPTAFLSSETWHGAAVWLGGHLPAGSHFNRVEMSTDLLLDWLGISGHSLTIGPGRVVVESKDIELFSLDYGHRFELWSRFNFSNDGGEFSLSNFASWVVELSHSMTLRELLAEVVGPLQDLGSFGSMHPHRVVALYLEPVGFEESGELITRLRGDGIPPRQVRLPVFEQLIPLTSIGLSRLRSVLPGWMQTYKTLRPIISRLLAIDYAPFIYEGHRSANVIQAAEGLHRALWDRTSLPPDEHAKRVDDALAGASGGPENWTEPLQEAKSWARPLLEGKNDLSQRTRLLEVVEQARNVGFPFVVPDVDKYVKALLKLRNAPAHGGSTSGDPEVNYWMIEGLRWMLRTILMHEIGLDPTTIGRRLSDIQALGHACRKLSWARVA
jgi:hypothetical protein